MKFKKLKRSDAQAMHEDLNTLATLLGEEMAFVLRQIAKDYLVVPDYVAVLQGAVKQADADEDDAAIERAVQVATTPTVAPVALYKTRPPKAPKPNLNRDPEHAEWRRERGRLAAAAKSAKKATEANNGEAPAKRRMGRPPKAAVQQ